MIHLDEQFKRLIALAVEVPRPSGDQQTQSADLLALVLRLLMPFRIHGQSPGVGMGASSKNTPGYFNQLANGYRYLCLFSVINYISTLFRPSAVCTSRSSVRVMSAVGRHGVKVCIIAHPIVRDVA